MAAPYPGRAEPVRGSTMSGNLGTSPQVKSTAAADAFSLGIEPGPFAPCCPRALFPGGTVNGVLDNSEPARGNIASSCPANSAGTVVADAMWSWLQSSGLTSGTQALEAQLRAAVPEAYED